MNNNIKYTLQFLLLVVVLPLYKVNAQTFVSSNDKLFGNNRYDNYKSFDFGYYKDIRRGLHYTNPTSKGKKAEWSKKYSRIDFVFNGKQLYAKSTMFRSSKFGDKDVSKCKVYYASNDQLFYDYNEKNRNTLFNLTYHENGKLANGIIEYADNPGVYHFVDLDEKGNNLADIAVFPNGDFYQFKKHPQYGNKTVENVTTKTPMFYSTNAKYTPATKPLVDVKSKFKTSYYGYTHVGTYYNREHGFNLTGFFLPTNYMMGNGSVLFLEDYANKKYYWVVVIDQELKFKIEADINEMPNVNQLKNSVNFEEFNTDKANLVSHNIKTLNGYGVNLTVQDNKKPGDGAYLEVGQFKNGKLHGVGYRYKMQYEDYQSGSVIDKIMTIDATYGIFENGLPKNVKNIKANKTDARQNIWDTSLIEGFNYDEDKTKASTTFKKSFLNTNLSALRKFDDVYITKIKRKAKVYEVNTAQKYILVYTDNEDVKAKLDINSGEIYAMQSYDENVNRDCPKTVKVPTYGVKQETVFIPGEFSSKTYSVDYNTEIRYTYYKPAEVTKRDVRYTTYVDQTCPRCNGTGKVAGVNLNSTMYRYVDFNDLSGQTSASNYTCLSGNCNNDFGSARQTSGDTYTGFFKDGMPNGYGVENVDKIGTYRGSFYNGKYEGFGVFTWKDMGMEYVGEWKNGKKEGYGYIKKGNTVIEAGRYINDILMNNDLLQRYFNNQWIVNCLGDCGDGFGKYKYNDQSSYLGFYSRNERAEVGEYHYNEGSKYLGKWSYGKYHRGGVLYYSNGSSYVGGFYNGKRDGMGIFLDKYGKVISKGEWKDDNLVKPSTSSVIQRANANAVSKTISNITRTTTASQPHKIDIGNKVLSPEVKTFFEAYNNNPDNIGQYITDIGSAMKSQNYVGGKQYPRFMELLTEIYNVDKYVAFKVMMRVDKTTLQEVLKLMPADMRTYIREQAKLVQQNKK